MGTILPLKRAETVRHMFTSVTFGYYLLTIFLWRIVISGYVSRFINLDYCVRSDWIFIL
nr:MAG TPA: hypothetical protein [Caudoviricetes sp.]